MIFWRRAFFELFSLCVYEVLRDMSFWGRAFLSCLVCAFMRFWGRWFFEGVRFLSCLVCEFMRVWEVWVFEDVRFLSCLVCEFMRFWGIWFFEGVRFLSCLVCKRIRFWVIWVIEDVIFWAIRAHVWGKKTFMLNTTKKWWAPFTPTIVLQLAHCAPALNVKWGADVRLYSLLLNLTFPRNLIQHLLVLGDCGKRIVLKSQWGGEYKALCLNPYRLLIMKNINAFFSFHKRVFAERLTHNAPYLARVHAKLHLVAREIWCRGHKSAGRNKCAYDAGAKCDAQHVMCYGAKYGACGGRFHIDVFNKKLVLGLFIQAWMSTLSAFKRPRLMKLRWIRHGCMRKYTKKRNIVKKKIVSQC